MKLILETDRLLLRTFLIEDAPLFYDLNADPEVVKYTGDGAFKSLEEAQQLIVNYTDYATNGFGRNTVVLKATQEVIGWCGLKKQADGMVDLGYRFFRKHWNRGYATEASRAMINYGFRYYGIEEIVGRAAQANKASVRVLEKIGMHFWKKEPSEGIEDTVWYVVRNKK